MTVDLIAQGVTIVLVIYFGLHLRSQLRTLKSTVEAQKSTIEAQAEHMRAQSAVLQDFERLNKVMQQVIDLFEPQAQLQREQAYRARVDRDMADLRQEMSQRAQQMARYVEELQERLVVTITENLVKQVTGPMKLLYTIMPFLHPGLRQVLIDDADLHPDLMAQLQPLVHGEYTPVIDEASLAQVHRDAFGGLRGPTRPAHEGQADQP